MIKIIAILSVVLLTIGCSINNESGDGNLDPADIYGQYKLTPEVSNDAGLGWIQYRNGAFVGSANGGSFTDINLQSKLRNFWSNEKYALHDRDNNGHFETIFLISNNTLVYVGSLGENGNFVDVAKEFKDLKGKSISIFIKTYS